MTTYTIRISEEQRAILEAAMHKYPKTEEVECALLVDLQNLPEDSKYMPFVTFFDEE